MKTALTTLYRAYMPITAREAIMARRRARVWQQHGVVFIHVPKCAGSSVNDALYGRFMGHIPADVIARFGGTKTAALPRFSLLRDPVSRAVSAYRFVRAGSGVGPGVTAQVRAPERYQIPAFESFDRFAQEWLPAQNLKKVDPVFRTQSSYVCDSAGTVLLSHLGHVEDMAPTTAWLSELLGRPVEIGRTNVTAPSTNAPKLEPSPESRRSIEAVYKDDVVLVNS